MAGNKVKKLILTCILTSGCAGPTTPLGAPWALDPSHLMTNPMSFVTSRLDPLAKANADTMQPNIEFYPPRQKLHGGTPLKIMIEDFSNSGAAASGPASDYKLIVRHNGIEVTRNFLKFAQVEKNGAQLIVKAPVIRLNPRQEHLIEFLYYNNADSRSFRYARLEPPKCNAFVQKAVLQTERFNPPSDWLQKIDKISKEMGFNTAFSTALIAQESGFDPYTVSWAKAIGLTQVTPTADAELQDTYSMWPRYPGLAALPAAWVKMLILGGQINPMTDWRLDVDRSIRGGLAYANLMAQRWSTAENRAKIKQLFPNADLATTQLLLASYNSGYARVASALNRYGAAWLTKAEELKEARNYVNRVLSYCDYFSMEEVFYANET